MAYLKVESAGTATIIHLAEDKATLLRERYGQLVGADDRSFAADVALLRTIRGWAIFDYTGHRTSVNSLRIADFKHVREGDKICIGDAETQLFEEIHHGIVQIGEPILTQDAVCYVDYCGFNIGDEVIYCPACGAPHHFDCWVYNQTCCANCTYCMPQKLAKGKLS